MLPTDDIVESTRAFVTAQGETAASTWLPERELLIVPHGKVTHFVHLGQLRERWSEGDAVSRRKLLERRLLALRTPPSALTDDVFKDRLLPRIRSLAYFEAQKLHRKIVERAEGEDASEISLPFKRLNDELGVHLVFELSEEAVDVNDARLTSWKRELEPLYAIALDHLRRRSEEPMHELKPKLFASTVSDAHDAARVLLTERLDALPLEKDQVVMLPHLDLLLVTDTGSAAALVEMARLGLQATQQPYGLSGTAFRRTSEGLVPWMPEQKHPAWDAMRMARIPSATRAYGRQKELLEAWHELEGDATQVAQLMVLEDKDTLFTAALLVQGQTALLPKAERIAFAIPERGDNARVWAIPWDVAVTLKGLTVRSVGMTPERFRATGFPDTALLDETLRNL